MAPNEKIMWASAQLRQKAAELGRTPKKEDFDDATKSRIKSVLGPWPRALEAAGLKETPANRPKAKKRKRNKDKGDLQ